MSKKDDHAARLVSKIFLIVFVAEGMYTFLPWIMPVGFIFLIPFVGFGVWHEWPRVTAWREQRRFRKELDRDLRSVEDSATL